METASSLQCTVSSKQVLGSPSDCQFVEGALVSLSLKSETFCQAPTLPHTSKGGGSNCSIKWSQLSDMVVIIVRQNLFCRTTFTAFKKKSGQSQFYDKVVLNLLIFKTC